MYMLLVWMMVVCAWSVQGQVNSPGSTSWVATDALGREVSPAQVGKRPGKTVGIFYFIWHGAHGYDKNRKAPDESVLKPLPTDTESPYDISKMLRENPDNPAYGPVGAFHYWGEPRFGYYLPDDEWIIRKHAQMLSDIDIDVIILDVTNAAIYSTQVRKICEVYTQMRQEGSRTPQIAFMLNSAPARTMSRLYESFYAKGLYKDLWFIWKGKPLVLCPPEGVTPQIAEFFTVRQAWFASTVGKWFGNGKDKWTWADFYPQTPGWHESPFVPEEISIAAATHPTSNIGRSYHNKKQPEPSEFRSGEGLFLAEQIKQALQVDPEFVFVTGWNEWIAQRFVDGRAPRMLGKPLPKGGTYFVDQYNEEYSRDIEPMRGGFEDNYYYQLASFVRAYKGGEQVPVVSETEMSLGTDFLQWKVVNPLYRDDVGDTFHRDHRGWGQLYYKNTSGRNDIIASRVAVSGDSIYFYVETHEPLTSFKGKDWMQLFLSVNPEKHPNWEEYTYAVNIEPARKQYLILSENKGGWKWTPLMKIPYRLEENKMVLSLPLSALGLSSDRSFEFDFKWVDNGAVGKNGDILMWQDHGDAAPNARFRYRFRYDGNVVRAMELKCESERNPIGVEEQQPRLSWQISSPRRNVMQLAYEIEVADDLEKLVAGQANVWRSGRCDSDQQLEIRMEGVALKSMTRYFWRVKVYTSAGTSDWSAPAEFTTGMVDPRDWMAQWITRSDWGSEKAMPLFRKKFTIAANQVERAVVYYSALGCGELWINGEPIRDRYLDPAQSNYGAYALYSSVDVTDMLKEDENVIGMMLGDGWYNQDVVWSGGKLGRYGDPLFRVQLQLEMKDGSRKQVLSDSSWEWIEGPIITSNIYAGEVYDARREISGWAEVGSVTGAWKPVVVAQNPPPAMKSQIMAPIRLQEEVYPVKLFRDGEGRWIFDFGKNITGVPQIQVTQPAGTRLKMRMGEVLGADRTINFASTGVKATGVIQTDEYICRGDGVEQWHPRFTYHGFRYLELTGQEGVPDPSWIKVLTLHNDMDRVGYFQCASEQINRLHILAVRTMLNNMQGFPSDCPHRERCGWLGDAHAELHMVNFNFGANNFWTKYLYDIRTNAAEVLPRALYHKLNNRIFDYKPKPAGLPYMISPGRRNCGVASPDWGTALVQIPWTLYLYYGNRSIIEDFYPDMKVWVDYNATLLNKDNLLPDGLGDWCPPHGNGTSAPVLFTSSAFHFLDLSIMEKCARLLGKHQDAEQFVRRKEIVRKAINTHLYDGSQKSYGSQTANAMALDMGIVPEEDQCAVSDALMNDMRTKTHGFMNVGIFGLSRIGKALSEFGNGNQAWELFTRQEAPSFATMWEQYDATTLWEFLPVDSIGYRLGSLKSSLCHPMHSGYDAWFYECIAGIRPMESAPGFKHICLKPTMTAYLPWAEGRIHTPYGEVVSAWKRENGRFEWNVSIPVNTSAEVWVPVSGKVCIDGSPVEQSGVKIIRNTQEGMVLHLGSGHYTISC